MDETTVARSNSLSLSLASMPNAVLDWYGDLTNVSRDCKVKQKHLLKMYSGVSQLESHVLTHYWISIMHVAIDYEFDNFKPTLTLTTSSCLLLRVDDKLVSNSTPDGVFDG